MVVIRCHSGIEYAVRYPFAVYISVVKTCRCNVEPCGLDIFALICRKFFSEHRRRFGLCFRTVGSSEKDFVIAETCFCNLKSAVFVCGFRETLNIVVVKILVKYNFAVSVGNFKVVYIVFFRTRRSETHITESKAVNGCSVWRSFGIVKIRRNNAVVHFNFEVLFGSDVGLIFFKCELIGRTSPWTAWKFMRTYQKLRVPAKGRYLPHIKVCLVRCPEKYGRGIRNRICILCDCIIIIDCERRKFGESLWLYCASSEPFCTVPAAVHKTRFKPCRVGYRSVSVFISDFNLPEVARRCLELLPLVAYLKSIVGIYNSGIPDIIARLKAIFGLGNGNAVWSLFLTSCRAVGNLPWKYRIFAVDSHGYVKSVCLHMNNLCCWICIFRSSRNRNAETVDSRKYHWYRQNRANQFSHFTLLLCFLIKLSICLTKVYIHYAV